MDQTHASMASTRSMESLVAAADAPPAVNLPGPSGDPRLTAGLREATASQDAFVASVAPYVGAMQQLKQARNDFLESCPRFVSNMQGFHQAMTQRSTQLGQEFLAMGQGPSRDIQRAVWLNDYMTAVAVDPAIKDILTKALERTMGAPGPHSPWPPARPRQRCSRASLTSPGTKPVSPYEAADGFVFAFSQAELDAVLAWAREWVQSSVGGAGIGTYFRAESDLRISS